MRGRYCESCNYAAYKGEPVFDDCPRCTHDTCDKCGKRVYLGAGFLTVNGKDYHFNCAPVVSKAKRRR